MRRRRRKKKEEKEKKEKTEKKKEEEEEGEEREEGEDWEEEGGRRRRSRKSADAATERQMMLLTFPPISLNCVTQPACTVFRKEKLFGATVGKLVSSHRTEISLSYIYQLCRGQTSPPPTYSACFNFPKVQI